MANYLNIIDFTNTISYSDLDQCLVNFFDENIMIYRLMNGVPNVKISSECNAKGALYRITTTDAQHPIRDIAKYLEVAIMTMYGVTYKTNVTYDGDSILVSFDKK